MKKDGGKTSLIEPDVIFLVQVDQLSHASAETWEPSYLIEQ